MRNKKCIYCNQIKYIKNFIFTKNPWRNPKKSICKNCIKQINPMDFKTIIKLCEYLDIPFWIDLYLNIYKCCCKSIRKRNSILIYISQMNNFQGFVKYTFQDSITLNTITEERKINK